MTLPGGETSPLVSIIIPTFNSARTLPIALESIARQTWRNTEVIVVDSFSSDNTVQIARGFGRVIVRLMGGERSKQINYGARIAKGKYVYRIDSDFRLEPRVVEEAVRTGERGADAVLIHNTSDPTISFWAEVRKAERDSLVDDWEHVAARFVRKAVFDSLGGFDESLYAEEDRDFHERLVEKGYKVGRIKSMEAHVGEPRTLAEVVRKHVYYAKSVKLYIARRGMRAALRLGPFRRAFLRHWRRIARDPRILLGFLVYQYVRYASSIAGLLSTPAGKQAPVNRVQSQRDSPGSKRVSVIVVTRDRPADLDRCLDSLAASEDEIKEVIIVDDASRKPLTLAGSKLPLKVLRNERRSFLAHSRNRGAKEAQGEWLMFVDDDNIVDARCLRNLRTTLDEGPRLAVASPLICYTSEPIRVWFAGGWVAPVSGIFVAAFRGLDSRQVPTGPYYTGVFHDAFMVRAAVLGQVGYFDEVNFPMYFGEADLAARVRERGFNAAVVPAAKVWHSIVPLAGGNSLLRGVHITEPTRAYFVGRNRLLYMRRHCNPLAFLLHAAVFEPLFFATHLFAMLSGHGEVPWTQLFGPYLRGVFDGLAGRVRLGRGLLRGTSAETGP